MNNFKDGNNLKEGFVTLMSVLVLSVIALTISVTLLSTGISSSQNLQTLKNNKQAQYLSNTCAQRALGNIRNDNFYTGTLSVSESFGECNATVENIGSSNKRIEIEANSNGAYWRVVIETDQVYPQLVINSWEEGSDFS